MIVVKFTANMATMYSRLLQKPKSSIFLFGPRGTGKSTWIRRHFSDAVYYDLLDSGQALRLERRPSLLFDELQTQKRGSWVVLDEVQKIPALLDEVHRLIETKGLRFVLCGSSARKLKRSGVNLLAGRAIVTNMYPLSSAELQSDFSVQRALQYGTMPMAIGSEDVEGYLATYAQTYLNEEIRAEALTRSVGAFSRFLEIAARQSGQVTNISNIARDAAVNRTTVQGYFDILVDTLIGYWIPAWKLKRATKQISHPKFYLFDTGVARALTGRLPYPPTQEECGSLLEGLLFAEVKAYLEYRKLRYQLCFWRNYDGTEVDLLCETKNGFVAVEIKAAFQWQRRFSRGLIRMQTELSPAAVTAYGVYQCERPVQIDNVTVLPVEQLLEMLWNDQIIR